MRTISVQQRRRALVARHHLGGDAGDPEAVTRALIALHATDPASVYLSVLARSAGSSLADVADAMYTRRSLVRWMAMRRTLFVFPLADVPLIQAAISTPLAAVLRRRLISLIARNGTAPPVDGDPAAWLAGLEARVEQALAGRGSATGAELSADVPGLRTTIQARRPSDQPQHITSPLLTIMSAAGRVVRGAPVGSWTSRGHRWEPVARWWPAGLPTFTPEDSQRELARRWLARFGPAPVDDLRWWAGWTKATAGQALSRLPVEEVDLEGETGIALSEPEAAGSDRADAAPVAALLPALDPTPMGWKRRDWFFGIEQGQVFDRNGNIGPTLWWDGEIIGSWAIAPGGDLRLALLADRGSAARAAIEEAAASLHRRLGGAVVTPAIRTPAERALVPGETAGGSSGGTRAGGSGHRG